MTKNHSWNKPFVLLALFILLASTSALMPVIHGPSSSSAYSTSEGTGAYVDQALFTSTVPSTMILGKSYTAAVYVVNNGTAEVSGFVIFAYPQFYFYSDQPTQTFNLAPGASEFFYFRYVASNTYSGKGLNVSAVLDVRNGSKLFVEDSVTVTVISIMHSRMVNAVWFAIIGVVIILGFSYAALSLFMKRRRKARGGFDKLAIQGQANTIDG